MEESTVSFPHLALDKFLGNNPDQDAKSFLLTFERRSISRLDHKQLTMLKEHAVYWEKKPYFSHFFEAQKQNGTTTQ